MKMAVFWIVTPCSLVALMMEAASTYETLVNFYQTTRRYNPEDNHLHFEVILRTIMHCYFLLMELMHRSTQISGLFYL
jgi:hypothetical protein